MYHEFLLSNWQIAAENRPDLPTLPAQVPGCVHQDLRQAALLPDPWFRDQEKESHWVADETWSYKTTFSVPQAMREAPHLRLSFGGIDTVAEIWLNGILLGKTDNMFRVWEFEVQGKLLPGENSLQVRFPALIPLMRAAHQQHPLPGWNLYHADFEGKSHFRKMACAFGWDWGWMCPTVGLWQPVKLLAFSERITHLRITQSHAAGGVRLQVQPQGSPGVRAELTLSLAGTVIATAAGCGPLTLDVPSPQLWWPNGMGGQPLYDLEARTASGQRLHRRIGLRTLELLRQPDEFGESFRFRVNGRDCFMKGANWIPCDLWLAHIPRETYARLLTAAADCHMNMIRVWGGGIYEHESFYDLCDELGLLVWQDFMFACSTYPAYDEVFLENCREEAVGQVRRLQHRACLALWCGNNELEQGLVRFDIQDWTPHAMPPDLYKRLFDDLLSEVVAAEDGITPYWPCSPHSPSGDRNHFNNPACGDAHAWSVWFGGESLEAQRNWNFRFMSEFGFQSFPELRSVEAFTLPEDHSLNNWIMEYHQRSQDGNIKIFRTLLDWFKDPADFESALLLSQLIQGLCIQVAAEHARRIQGRMDGLLYWQLNDLWPGATWSSIDVYGRWKSLQHLSRRFFAPVAVSLLEDAQRGSMAIHLSNHLPETFTGTLHWLATTAAGEPIAKGGHPVSQASQSASEVLRLDCQAWRDAGGTAKLPLEIRRALPIPQEGDRDLLIWAWILDADGAEISRNFGAFCRPKYWKLASPRITCGIQETDQGFALTLHTDVCAPWTRLSLRDTDAQFSDNDVLLLPQLPLSLTVTPAQPLSVDELRRQLRIQPLTSLCR